MKTLRDVDCTGKTVFIRADLNVPLTDSGAIADDTRIVAALPTIKLACQRGAAVVLASHLGRPKGERKESLSLRPVAEYLQEKVDTGSVTLAGDCIGDAVQTQKESLAAGDVLLLENLRFHAEEEKNDDGFAKALAQHIDIYVNDAFGTAHRAHASTVGMVQLVETACAGELLKQELDYFNTAFDNPARPLIAIFGGAKISTKLAAIKNTLDRADTIIIGGAMANTFFAADGLSVGKSLIEEEQLGAARDIRAAAEASSCELVLPVDVLCGEAFSEDTPVRAHNADAIPENEMALDIGPRSIELFSEKLESGKTIIWNGPMGAFELDPFSKGTYAMVDALAQSSALTVVGGGDTDLALHRRHATDKMSYVSTGGGAFLKLLEGETLPAVEALR